MANDTQDVTLAPITLGTLRENLPFLTRALRAYIRAENADFYATLDAGQGEIVVLTLIALNPGMSQNDLASALVFKKSAVTKLVKELETQGLVERAKSATDKRVNALHLTNAGQARYQRIKGLIDEQQATFLAPFTTQEQAEMFGYLNRLFDHLAERHRMRTGLSAGVVEPADD